jgi:hypothetical protein
VLDADSYTVYYHTGTHAQSAVTWSGPVTLEAGSASAVITGLEADTAYYVWVSARNRAGESPKSPWARAETSNSSGGWEMPRVFFDHGWMIPNYAEAAERFYTVSQGRSLVMSPVYWMIPDGASSVWQVDGQTQAASGRYFTFTPGGTGNYRVTVTVTHNGTPYTAETTVVCTGAYTPRAATEGSKPFAKNAFGFMPGPGQFVDREGTLPYRPLPRVGFGDTATTVSVMQKVQQAVSGTYSSGWGFSLGSYGGYLITGFDHSVARREDGGYELDIRGNAFVTWVEPGVVWVARDDNGDGIPNDTWYELKGSACGRPAVRQQYAITWYRGGRTSSIYEQRGIWRDSLGNVGTYPKGYPLLSNLSCYTVTGTLIPIDTVMDHNSAWGYVDIVDPQKYRLSNAIQLDGTPANLDYIDFVKVQNGSNEMAGGFGEISCETGVPFDVSIPDPSMRIRGAPVTGGQYNGMYSFRFVNGGCGYDLFVMVDGGTHQVFRTGQGPTEYTHYAAAEYIYFDYYGGNVNHSNPSPGIITFGALPAEYE